MNTQPNMHMDVADILVTAGAPVSGQLFLLSDSNVFIRWLLSVGFTFKNDEILSQLNSLMNTEVVRVLLDRGVMMTSLAETVFYLGDVVLFEELLRRGLSPDMKTVVGVTIIYTAVSLQNESMIKLLLRHKANIKGIQIVSLAVSMENYDVLKLLLDNGADPNESLYPTLQEKMTDRMGMTFDQWKFTTPLQEAIEEHETEMVKLLLDHGANPNVMSGSGKYPLTTAVREQYTDILDVLLKAPVDLEVRDYKGRTALFIAVEHSLQRVVLKLLKAKADPKAVDLAGNTPLKIATANKRPVIVDMLITAGAKIRERSTCVASTDL